MGAEGEGGWECFFDSDEFVRSAGAYVCVGWDQGEFFEFVLLDFCANVFIWQGLPPVSRPTTPQGEAWRIAPPSTRRFLECSDDDLKIGEVVELLKEYRRLVEDVRMAGLGVFGGCVS